MILYHMCWIMNHFGLVISDSMLYGRGFLIWERSICMSFILIAGFCFSFGHHHLRTGLVLFGIGLVITFITVMFVPGIPIIFGILTFLGSATLIMIPADMALKGMKDRSNMAGSIAFFLCIVIFIITYNINHGHMGIPYILTFTLPERLYKGYIATYIGFMDPGFYSADYFPVIPWIFLYMGGYFLHKTIRGGRIEREILVHGLPGISAIGRHSLPIYLIHPIVLYIIIYIISIMA